MFVHARSNLAIIQSETSWFANHHSLLSLVCILIPSLNIWTDTNKNNFARDVRFCAMNTEGGIVGGRNQQQSKNRVRTGEARLQNNTRVSPWVLHVCFSWRVYVRTYTYGGVSSGRCIIRSGQNCTVSSLPCWPGSCTHHACILVPGLELSCHWRWIYADDTTCYPTRASSLYSTQRKHAARTHIWYIHCTHMTNVSMCI